MISRVALERKVPRILAAAVVAFAFAFGALGGIQTAHAKYASIVIDAQSGEVLYSRNADTRNYPASLTKMMTLYLMFEALERRSLRLNQKLPISQRAANQEPSRIGLRAGRKISVQNLILALAVKSANDAAVVVAEYLGKTEAGFARMMTKKARMLGMRNTTFRNASGLPNRGQLSTARDMAILARALLRDFPGHYDYFSKRSFRYGKSKFYNHNRLLTRYSGTDGIKTGYIRASGFNVVVSVQRNGRRLIGVVFGGRTAKSRDHHMASLMDKGFQRIQYSTILAARPQRKPPHQFGVKEREGTPRTRHKPIQNVLPAQPPPVELAVVGAPTTPKKKPVSYRVATLDARPVKKPRARTSISPAWAVQVGAFGAFTRAHLMALDASERARYQLAETEIQIVPFATGGATLYRARLLGFSEPTARMACLNLRKQSLDCIVVPPDGIDLVVTTLPPPLLH